MTSVPVLPQAPVAPRYPRRNRARLLESFDAITESCSRILATDHGHFESAGELYSLPRFVYVGRPGGGEMIRLGVFATLHGDEPEGALALIRFLERLAESPDLGQGFGLFLYPLCNPTGFEDHQREARTGVDLNREFWRNSHQPEVQFLESEIQSQSFHGIISLHSDDTSDGLYGFVRGAVLSEHLLEPALRQGNRFLSRNRRPQIDGFAARESIIHSGYPGMLQSAPETPRRPFEITWETPQKAPLDRQVSATVEGLEAILAEYRRIQSFANHI
ncbi:MAG: succinylglutamate desuccinylase/aspartoacylase family protein [Verrucomicrobia bacterium]|nr:succinylglutamate desuccinylase/aspartoacylase family protein [Verrucomicrobiota bacterium]